MHRPSFIVAGLGFGDEGKGTITEYLTERYSLPNNIRYNGGSQAAHHVVSPEGVKHCFAQFGSGTFVPETITYLSRFMAINPFGILEEMSALKERGITAVDARLFIDARCPVVTDLNILLNRMQEASRGKARHGSCGKGVGFTLRDRDEYGDRVLLAGDLRNTEIVKEKLNKLKNIRIEQAEEICRQSPEVSALSEYLELIKNIGISYYAEFYRNFSGMFKIVNEEEFFNTLGRSGSVFEGAQGALLDADNGFLPYVTWSRTTMKQAEALLSANGFTDNIKRIGILRAYSTRHGAGPFVTEDLELSKKIPPCDNETNAWQGPFRSGWFDLVSARYAIDINEKIDSIAITNMDRLNGLNEVKVCLSYVYEGEDTEILNKYFCSEKIGVNKYKIRSINKSSESFMPKEERLRVTSVLQKSKPLDFKIFNGWNWNIERSNKNKFYNLPLNVRNYLNFLRSKDGLDVPISIVSFGPRASDKIEI